MKLLWTGFCAVGLVAAGQALALDPNRSLTQLHHASWASENGAPPDIWALAQSADGYLWLGTGAGLYRFDGVRFEKYRPVATEVIPSANINALCATSGGDIWVGYQTGTVARIHENKLAAYEIGLAGESVYQIVEDSDRVIWAALQGPSAGGLARFSDNHWQVLGRHWGVPEGGVTQVLPSATGDLWVVADKGLLVLRHGASHFDVVGEGPAQNSQLLQTSGGKMWLFDGVTGKIHTLPGAGRFAAQVVALPRQPPPALEPGISRTILDRDGALWGTYQAGGIFRIASPDMPACEAAASCISGEKFTLQNGLSSDLATPVLEDHEGDIWVGTNLGLDQFRAANAVLASGLPVTSRHGFFMARGEGNTMYAATGTTLYRAYSDRVAAVVGQLDAFPTFLSVDNASRLWIGSRSGLGILQNNSIARVNLPPSAAGRVLGWAQSPNGKICISVAEKGIFCLLADEWTRTGPPIDAAHPAPNQLVFDRNGRLWLTYARRLALLDGSQIRMFSSADGLDIGGIDVVVQALNEVLVGGEFGIARFDGQRFTALKSDQNPDLSRITGIVQTTHGTTWLNGIAGVVRIDTKDLNEGFETPLKPVLHTLLTLADGLPGTAQQDSNTLTAIEGSDGLLWFVTSHGIAWVDPKHLVHNPVAPPVAIRSLKANGIEYPYPTHLVLPKGVANLQIDYTALSFSISERVHFRYRLDGVDTDWIDPGPRRTAFYTKLDPGDYHFRVIAANNDGVWNNSGAAMSFSIPPTFIQSIWFKACLAAGAMTLLCALYYLRLKQLTDRVRNRLEARLSERERIARELHDTLLQGFQGLLLRFGSVAEQLQPSSPARKPLEDALDLAEKVLSDGRDRLVDLRTSDAADDVSQSIFVAARNCLADAKTNFSVTIEGTPRELHPIAREEILSIANEAIYNATRHARAADIEVGITYHPRAFRLSIRDNGVGIDPVILGRGVRHNHFGLTGMRERAEKIRGAFTITSRPSSGTEITVSVAAPIAYALMARQRPGGFPRKSTFEV